MSERRVKPQLPTRVKSRARELRRRMTMPERLLWSRLRGRRLNGLKFKRQHPIGRYVADFFCHEKRLVVELDGMSHDGRRSEDASRTARLERTGLCVVRVTNDQAMRDLDAVCDYLIRIADRPSP